ncbi:molybdopterin dehydrogenase FAD-binding protein [Segniliparus rotundus DSM 44985]|uniref:Molybdopterin dehydrogenase FAD-binding protein n=1 Tax=Segniliparus rotundus (strain ATCC BAA-972 / CDC 1076 / CIP 108378 / DSM 44985 / JCM 13578) TaxID=640132 RepID=D6Z7S4_SEGRD|nr:FAD binding domain-containing protein [Segniliparus rotundus]ADG98004.1 molybdopterin dehydrogenase FAD-binding protein [Segniliparus rotundus DSM 44985]
MSHPQVTVNGKSVPIPAEDIHTTALDFVRSRGWTGAKEGCAEGECGACAVLVAKPGLAAPTEWTAVNACLVPVATLDGQEILTAEGLGSPAALHPVQYEMAVRGGSQCGYCTPGFICSMAAEFYRPDRGKASEAGTHEPGEVGPNGFDLHALSGNLCRCTGYRPIRDAAFAVGDPDPNDPLAKRGGAAAPPAKKTDFQHGGCSFVRPASLHEALRLVREDPSATIVAGSTDLGVEVNIRGKRPERVIAVDRLPELRRFAVEADAVEIGAAIPLTEVERRLGGLVPLLGQMLPQFASRLIRNSATLGGNLGTGSPIGDSAPALLALGAELVLVDADGERVVALSDYFTGYRQSVRRPDELIRAVRVPLPLASVTGFHKIAKRRFDDISSVAAAFAFDVEDGVVRTARIGLGGVAATPIRALRAEAALEGKPWSLETAQHAAHVLREEGTPLDDHRASARYRAAMLEQTLLKQYAATTREAVA